MSLDQEAPERLPCRVGEVPESCDQPLQAFNGVELYEDGRQDFTTTDHAAQHKSVDVAKPHGAAAMWSASRFRTDILVQVAERDRPSHGVQELYEQYVECLQCLKLLRGSSCFRDSLVGSDASPSPSSTGSPRGSCSGQLQEAVQCAPNTAQQESGRLMQKLRMREQELEALQQVLREREEELKEKEQAHTLACRQATQLGRENADLRAQFAKVREQLQLRGEEVEGSTAEQHASGAGCKEATAAVAAAAAAAATTETTRPMDLPPPPATSILTMRD